MADERNTPSTSHAPGCDGWRDHDCGDSTCGQVKERCPGCVAKHRASCDVCREPLGYEPVVNGGPWVAHERCAPTKPSGARKKQRTRRIGQFSQRGGMTEAFVKYTREYGLIVETEGSELDAKECRRFARWLRRAADYMEARDGR